MAEKTKVGGARREGGGAHERRAGRELAAGPPGWPIGGAGALRALPRRAAAFLRFFFLAAPLSPLPRTSVPARVHGDSTFRGPWLGDWRLHRLVAPNACPEPPSWQGEAFVVNYCDH